MGLISQRVKAIAEAITDVTYFRLSTTQKAEFELSRKALRGKTAIVYADNPDIPIDQNPITITENFPVRVLFLQLQDEPDETEIDLLLDSTKSVAFEFYRKFRDEPFFNIEDVSEVVLSSGQLSYQLGVEYLSGHELTFVMALETCLDSKF